MRQSDAEIILAKLQKHGKSIRWLSNTVPIPYRNLYESLHNTRLWRSGELQRIYTVLEKLEGDNSK